VTREAVRSLHERGLTQREIAKALEVTKSTVAFHIRRLDQPPDERFALRYDWSKIRAAYEAGLSLRQGRARFGFTAQAWYDAVARGDVTPRPTATPIEQLFVAGPRRSRHHLAWRLLRAGIKKNRCEQCGITSWRGKPLNMALHHVNGDGSANRLENLRLLCPNCHAQTPNYGGRNGHRRNPGSAT
jgi:HNH endonuclease